MKRLILVATALGLMLLLLFFGPPSAAQEPQFEQAPKREAPAQPPPVINGHGTGFIPSPMDLSHLTGQKPQERLMAPQLPASFDWRTTGKVTAVKDQGGCGSCYAFAAIADFESKILIDDYATLPYPDYSENNAKECNYYDTSCSGGRYWQLVNWLSKKGTVLESCDPYQASDVACNSTCPYQKTLLDWRIICGNVVPDTSLLKTYIQTYGPVFTSMYASFTGFGTYNGTYTLHTTDTTAPDHAVLIVGWDDSLSHAGGTGGWIVKNSWGTAWGNGGYFTIAYGSASIGMDSSFLYKWQDYDQNGSLYYYDEAGMTNALGQTGGLNTTSWGLCKVIPADDTPVEFVEFWTTDITTDVDVYLYDDFNGTTTTLSNLLASKLNSSFSEAGYHSVALDAPVPMSAGDDVIAVVKFTNSSIGYPVPIDDTGPNETGRTYISLTGANGTWTDLKDILGGVDVCIRVRTSTLPPMMESILESEGQYYNTAPSFSNFGFDDNVSLDDGWYQMDSFSGSWTTLFTDVTGASWDNDGWTIPGFGGLSDGTHTIYFKASDDASNVEGEAGEWSWQFYNNANPPTMTIAEAEGQYFNTAPVFSSLGFDDTIALDDGWYQMDSYSGGWTVLFTDVAGTSWSSDNWTVPGFGGLGEGSHTIYFKASDDASNVEGELGELSWQFYKDTAPPADPTSVAGTSHTVSVWSGDNTVEVTWTAASDSASGLDGYSILWDTSANTTPPQVKNIEEGVVADTSSVLADGNSHYFHISSVDNVGNWQSTVHLGPFYIETVPPTDPTNVTSTSHTLSVWSADNTVEVTWTAASDNTSGLDGYSTLWNTSANTTPPQTIDIQESVTSANSTALADGSSHYFHISSVDNAGNWQSTVHLGPFFIDATPPTMTIAEAEGQYFSDDILVFDSISFNDGIALDDGWYQMEPFSGNWTALFTNWGSTSWSSGNWTIPDFGALDEGSHTIYFKASDNLTNVEGESGEWYWQFYKDTIPPAAVTDLAVSSPTGVSLVLTWTAPADTSPGVTSSYDIRHSSANLTAPANWDSAIQCTDEPTPSSANTTEFFTVTGLSDNTVYYFALKTSDSQCITTHYI